MNIKFTKTMYIMLSLILIGGTAITANLYYNEITSEYNAAIDAVSKIGILSQSIVSYAEELPEINTEFEYQNMLNRIRRLVDILEIRHLSMFSGRPDFGRSARYADEIKIIYFTPPYDAVSHVQNFLYHATQILNTPYKAFKTPNPHLQAMHSAIKGEMILSLSQIISLYKNELEARVNTIIITSMIFFLLILIIDFVLAIHLFADKVEKQIQKAPEELSLPEQDSVAPILNELPVPVSQESQRKKLFLGEFVSVKPGEA
ncbi:MAG: hypothetical protein D6748_06875 [Calditrichaeota bacterium]|nr:MAG: hypothetical protein D6748_06875 [Calditrichota bacterium]